MARRNNRPSLSSYDAVQEITGHGRTGFDGKYNFRLRFTGAESVAYSDLIINLAWQEDKKLIPSTNRIERKITAAEVQVFKAGAGWIKLQDNRHNEFESEMGQYNNHFREKTGY